MATMAREESVTLRLTKSEKADLEAAATLTGQPPGTLAAIYVKEGVKRSRFPAVEYRDGAPGRVAYVSGQAGRDTNGADFTPFGLNAVVGKTQSNRVKPRRTGLNRAWRLLERRERDANDQRDERDEYGRIKPNQTSCGGQNWTCRWRNLTSQPRSQTGSNPIKPVWLGFDQIRPS